MIDMQLQFPDKCVTYSTFMEDLAYDVALVLHRLEGKKEKMSQNEAREEFGKGVLARWLKKGLCEPTPIYGKTGKLVKLEYKYSELEQLRKHKL